MEGSVKLMAGTAAIGVVSAAALYYLLGKQTNKKADDTKKTPAEETEPLVLKEPSPALTPDSPPESIPEQVNTHNVADKSEDVPTTEETTSPKTETIEMIGEISDNNPDLITSLSQLEREDSINSFGAGDTSESNGNDNNGNEDSIIIVNAEDVEKADN